MKQQDRNPKQSRPRVTIGMNIVVVGLLFLGLLAASSASAAFEQVGCFAGREGTPQEACGSVSEEKFSEEVQLGGVGGMAVNYTGAGGVPAGTLYAVSYSTARLNEKLRIAMYEPQADGGLKFSEEWEVTAQEEPYERCGPPGELPDGETVHPSCPRRPEAAPRQVDIDVDQSTGNVYAFNGVLNAGEEGKKKIVEYTADGGEVIARFGEQAPASDKTGESPEKIHGSTFGGVAVDAVGAVYVIDINQHSGAFYNRLMVFEPQSPGDYEHYAYAGETAAGVDFVKSLASDAAGHIYVVARGERIEEYAPGVPAAFPAAPSSPICQFKFTRAGVESLTLDPLSAEVFFFSFKTPKRVRRIGACDEATGEFAETEPEPEAFKVAPERDDLLGLAFDPVRQIEASRTPGVLYGGAPNPVPNNGIGVGEPGQSSLGYIFSHSKEVAPNVEAQSVTHVGTTSALLHATINPNSFETHYIFQYLSAAQYEANLPGERFAGASEAPLGGGTLQGGQGVQSIATAISGLSPDTEYRYRAFATSECATGKTCEGKGEGQSFRTFPAEAPGLPDHRAWELVSPTLKNGGQVFPADPRISSCGSEMVCKPGNNDQHFPMQSTLDGSAIVYEGTPFSAGEGAVSVNEYIARRNENTGWQTVNLSPALLSQGGTYKAFSADLTDGLLEQDGLTLTPEAPSEYTNLYAQPTTDPLALQSLLVTEPPNRPAGELGFKYAGASADLSRVFFAANDALSEETPFAPEALDGGASKFNLYEWNQATGQLALVNVKPGNIETEAGASFGDGSANAVSADGLRVFWSDEAGHVYVREDGETTKAIPDLGKFLSAAVDGSKVLLSSGHLYDLETEATTDLTEGKGGFQGIAGQSDDLSHVYFVDTEVLSGEEENNEGAKAQAAKFNLYAWREGNVRYVATLIASDNTGEGISPISWSPNPSNRTAKASPSGNWLAFVSKAPLSGYDSTGPCESDHAGGLVDVPCPEVFLYDSQRGELICASCNPSGTAALGWSVLRLIKGGAGPQPRYLSDSGRLFFDSQDSLSPFDTNEGVEDVYQYEPQGVGTCERKAGCLSLISAGHEAVDSNFLAADPSGKNVFFTTRDQLSLKDKDDLIDLYVAREGGGIPGETEVARSECQGEACVPALAPPNDPTPGSSSFEGAGNVDEKKATKKHKKKKHAKKHKSHKRSHGRAAKNNRGGAK